MGTSTSHASPETLGWKAVHAGYVSSSVPIDRVAQEIWRASLSQPDSITRYLLDTSVFLCYQAVKESESQSEALKAITDALSRTKSNSIITELARRAAVESFLSTSPSQSWAPSLFGQITEYLVSRDLSGFVGRQFRNQNLGDLLEFKSKLRARVKDVIARVQPEPYTMESWRSFVATALSLLTRGK